MADPYAVLGVPRGSARRLVRRAYRIRCMELHPDRNKVPERAANGMVYGSDEIRELNEAYHAIIDETEIRDGNLVTLPRCDIPVYCLGKAA